MRIDNPIPESPGSSEPEDAGNHYVTDVTVEGVRTFRHVATGEVLHGQVGPWKEAWNLYVLPAGLDKAQGRMVVHDVAMGCGAQLLAALESFERNPKLERLDVVSFDLERTGLTLLREHLDDYDYATPHAAKLDAMIASDTCEWVLPDGRKATWRFVGGDYRKTVRAERDGGAQGVQAANVVFYDFFSPARHPWLWRLDVMREVFARVAPGGRLFTYTSATCVRATMAAAGFFVGLGEPSGKKMPSTIAAHQLEDLSSPLPARWKETFFSSHKAFVEGEGEDAREEIRVAIAIHPQFMG